MIKIKESRIRWIWQFFQFADVLFGTAVCSRFWELLNCHGEAATICPATTHVSARAGSYCRHTDCLLALRQERAADNALHIEERVPYNLRFKLWRSCFLQHLRCKRLPVTVLVLGFQDILKNPCLINFGATFLLDSCKMLQKQTEAFHTFLWHFPSLKQNFIAYRSSKVQIAFLKFTIYTLIFIYNLPKSVLVHVQPLYWHDIDPSLTFWKPFTSEIIFQLIVLFFEPLVPLNNMCVRHGESPYIC